MADTNRRSIIVGLTVLLLLLLPMGSSNVRADSDSVVTTEVFRRLDFDNDGALSVTEIDAANEDTVILDTTSVWPGQYDDRLKPVSRFDEDRDSKISPTDFDSALMSWSRSHPNFPLSEWLKFSLRLPEHVVLRFALNSIDWDDIPHLVYQTYASDLENLIPSKLLRARFIVLARRMILGHGYPPSTMPQAMCTSDGLFTHTLRFEVVAPSSDVAIIKSDSVCDATTGDVIKASDPKGDPHFHLYVVEERYEILPSLFGRTFEFGWREVAVGQDPDIRAKNYLTPLAKREYRLRLWNRIGPSKYALIKNCEGSSTVTRVVFAFVLLLCAVVVASMLVVLIRACRCSQEAVDTRTSERSVEKPSVLAFFVSPTEPSLSLSLLPEIKILTRFKLLRNLGDLHCTGTLDDLQTALLNRRPRVLHLAMHTFGGSLVFAAARDESKIEVVERALLVDIIASHVKKRHKRLQCIFINACCSHALACLLRDSGVPFTICWKTKTDNGGAIMFAEGFYRAIATGATFQEAFEHGTFSMRKKYSILDPEDASAVNQSPCKKRPGWSPAAYETAATGRSHRSKLGKAKLKDAIERTRSILKIPQDYKIGIVPASDTGAVEMAMWSMLGERPVDLCYWESFGKGWCGDAKLLDIEIHEHSAGYGDIPDLNKTNPKHDIVFTWNGTTSGVCVPNADWISDDREGITINDATSAAFAMDIDWSKVDVTTYSWQKVLGGEGAHGMIILSPRAVERLESYTPPRPLPKIFRMTKGGKLIDGIFT
eukprot:g512.t1